MSYKFEESQYYLTINMEVISELAAEVLADYFHYFTEKEIDFEDSSNPLVLLYDELLKEKKRILSSEVKEIKDLYLIEGKIQFCKQYLCALKGIESV